MRLFLVICADLHDRFVIVPADKASNDVVFICKTYYYSCLQKELIDDKYVDTSTYQRTNFTKEEFLINHRSDLSYFGINTLDDDADLPSLYWIPKYHKDPYEAIHNQVAIKLLVSGVLT